jgi:hypothetical protein
VAVHSGKNYEIKTTGLLRPHEQPTDKLWVLFVILCYKSCAEQNRIYCYEYNMVPSYLRIFCEILGFHGNADSSCSLLVCDRLPTYWRILHMSAQRWKHMVLPNIVTLPHHYMVSQPWKPWLEYVYVHITFWSGHTIYWQTIFFHIWTHFYISQRNVNSVTVQIRLPKFILHYICIMYETWILWEVYWLMIPYGCMLMQLGYMN